MPSLQQSAGAGKAAKFVAANPLGPMADPFQGMGDDEKEYHKELSENINRRMTNAMEELKERHAKGTNKIDDPDRAPTGPAYRDIHAQQKRQEEANRRKVEHEQGEEERRRTVMMEEAKRVFDDGDTAKNTNDDDSDDEDWLDEDPELDAIRQRRILELRQQQAKNAEQKALGHGEYRTISQDEFLPECTGQSQYVAVHFFHSEFERCKVMDHHLKIIAPLHISCKFLRIDAEKAPFFITKLKVQTLPTLIVLKDGKVVDRLTGFEGLTLDPAEPDKWHTGRLRQWIATTGAIKYKVPTEEVREEMRRMGIRPRGAVWTGTSGSGYQGAEYSDDEDN